MQIRRFSVSRVLRPVAFCGILWLLGCGAAPALTAATPGSSSDLADLSLEELMAVKVREISTASRFAQKPAEAPASVTVITGEEIRLFGYRTLAEVLQGVRGMYLTYDRSYTYLGVRGFSRPSDYNSRVLLLVDGHRVNDNIFGGAMVGREFMLDVDLIDRVEIVRGPSSSLYGSGAFFAVINVFTRSARDLRTGEVSFDAGSYDSYKERFTLAGVCTNTGAEYVLSGSRYESAGRRRLYYREFDTPETNNGVAENADREEAENFYLRVRYGELTLSGAFVARKKHIPTASWETVFNDSRYYTYDAHGYLDLEWRHSLAEGGDVMARAYYDDYRYEAEYPGAPYVDEFDRGLTRDDGVGRMVGAELQWSRRWNLHTVTVGGEARRHLALDQSYYAIAPRDTMLDSRRRSYDAGMFAQDSYALASNLLVNGGLRWDYYDSFGGSVNPRLGLIYSPLEQTTLKFLYGRAYRAPNAFELYYEGEGNEANPELKPETIQTFEIVMEQGLPGALSLTVAPYYYRLDDLISQTGDDVYQFQNMEEARARGVETELEWKPRSGVRVRASGTIQHAEKEETGEELANSPREWGRLAVSVPLIRDRLHSAAEVQYTGRCRTQPDRETRYADEHTIVNWTFFSRGVFRGAEVSAGVYNLFNTSYAVPGGTGHMQDVIWQDGRNYRIQLTYRF